MKKFSLKYLLLLAGVILLTLHACKKDEEEECCDPANPDCINYDPCLEVEEPTAEIILQGSIFGPEGFELTPDDSLFFNEVFFSSPFNGPQYTHTWYLGAEVITEASFSREHSFVERPAQLTVSHVLEYPVDSVCYPNSTGRDSTSRDYYLIHYVNEFGVYSKYRGVFENETDSFDFEFKLVFEDNSPVYFGYPNDLEPVFVTLNFDNQGDSANIAVIGRNSIGYFTGDGNSFPSGSIKIEQGIARLDYTYQLESSVVYARILD